jgi:hypothetical protein
MPECEGHRARVAIHLVGDIHQPPTHGAAVHRLSIPRGDRGGNVRAGLPRPKDDSGGIPFGRSADAGTQTLIKGESVENYIVIDQALASPLFDTSSCGAKCLEGIK